MPSKQNPTPCHTATKLEVVPKVVMTKTPTISKSMICVKIHQLQPHEGSDLNTEN